MNPWNVCGPYCVLDWSTDAEGYLCGDRIEYLIEQRNYASSKACRTVAKSQFPHICGNCDPDAEKPIEPAEGILAPKIAPFCGCDSCDSNVWDTIAGLYSCGSRIGYLLEQHANVYTNEQEACRRVGGEEFPQECGACNPDSCTRGGSGFNHQGDDGQPRPRPRPQMQPEQEPTEEEEPQEQVEDEEEPPPEDPEEQEPQETTPEETPQESLERPTLQGPPPDNSSLQQEEAVETEEETSLHSPPMELYCYPPFEERTIYNNVFGNYWVEVKEGDKCGPSDNLFTKEAVSVSNDLSELTLTMGRQPDGRWSGSEVRILLPEPNDYYDYGTYRFSVKTIEVRDTVTNTIVSNRLPISVILGLFTWDDTQDFSKRAEENWMHEVDVEISQWNIPNNEDVQFLVQPPGSPQKYRFYSGSSPTVPAYKQAPNTYEFDWNPAEITWSSSAGGGQTFTYSTQDALDSGQPDYTQCMPANVEVRINLWHLFGSSPPAGLEDTHEVRVVIDDFYYEPSGIQAVPDGGVCSKDCHCGGPPFVCINNRCTEGNENIAASASGAATEESSWGQRHPGAVTGILMMLILALLIIGLVVYRRRAEKREAHDSFDSDNENDWDVADEEEVELELAMNKTLKTSNGLQKPSEDVGSFMAIYPTSTMTLPSDDESEESGPAPPPNGSDRYAMRRVRIVE
ncbi:expressed unknown protein [Seminavis robusta]|uniref:GH16 domain-containing protein n=1 Tax=Seminavis robusta TaxID=568900 RepID=A0A9N8H2S5_9STRA|nr:expressed unknown protein [Seminavis robusta]|eukprot:Sro13_g010350.1 n/a (683) ;mRNA; r:189171-191219